MLSEFEKRYLESLPVYEVIQIISEHYLKEYRKVAKDNNCYESRKIILDLIENISTESVDECNIKHKKYLVKELIDIYEYMCITAK
jgi:hypothetical protein